MQRSNHQQYRDHNSSTRKVSDSILNEKRASDSILNEKRASTPRWVKSPTTNDWIPRQKTNMSNRSAIRTRDFIPRRSSCSINQIVARHQKAPLEEQRCLFEEVERSAPLMSPRTAVNYLQISAKLLGQGETVQLDYAQKTASTALAERLLIYFGGISSPTSASREMNKAGMTTKDVALAAWSLGRLKLNQVELIRLLAFMMSGSISTFRCELNDGAIDNTTTNHVRPRQHDRRSGPNSIDISNLLWACSRVQFRERPLLLTLIEEAVRQLQEFDSHSLASLFVAVGTLGLRKTNLTPDLRDVSQSSLPNMPRIAPDIKNQLNDEHRVISILYDKLGDFDTRRLCNFYWSCGKLQWKSNRILNRTIELLLHQVDNMTPQHISNIWWASGQLEFKHELLTTLSSRLISPPTESNSRSQRQHKYQPNWKQRLTTQVMQQDAQGIGNIFWSLGRLLIQDLPLLNCLAEGAIHQRHRLLPQHLSNIAWSCGKLGYFHERLCCCLAEESVVNLPQFNSQNLANVFWGLGKVGWTSTTSELIPPPSTVTPVVLTLLKKLPEFGSQSVANMLLACVYLNWNHPVVVKALIKRAQQIYLPMAYNSIEYPSMTETWNRFSHIDEYETSRESQWLDQDKQIELTTNDDGDDGDDAIDGQHLSNICWAVGSLQRDQHASSSDTDALCHHAVRLFSVTAFLLVSDQINTFTRCPVASPTLRQSPRSESSTATAQLRKVPVQQLSLVLWGFASVRLRHDLLFQLVTDEINRRLMRCETELTRYKRKIRSPNNAIFVEDAKYSNQEYRDNDVTVLASAREFLCSAVPALCQMMWALGRVFYRHWDLVERCIRLLVIDLVDWRNQNRNSRAMKSWFWNNATLQNASNIIWGITVTVFRSGRDWGSAAYVKAGAISEASPCGADSDTVLPESSAEPQTIRVMEDALVQLCLGTIEVYFDKTTMIGSTEKSLIISEADPRDIGQLFYSLLASKHILRKRLEEVEWQNERLQESESTEDINGHWNSRSIQERESPVPVTKDFFLSDRQLEKSLSELKKVIEVLEWLKPQIPLSNGRVSETHARVKSALVTLLSPTSNSESRLRSPSNLAQNKESSKPVSFDSPVLTDSSDGEDLLSLWSPETTIESPSISNDSTLIVDGLDYTISEEEISEDMLSCDIVIRIFGRSPKCRPKKIVIEVDGPWHYIRVIRRQVLDDLSPLSPGLFNSKRRRVLRKNTNLTNVQMGDSLHQDPSHFEDTLRGFYLCLDGRTRLKQRLFDAADLTLINLPFYELASADQLTLYLESKLLSVFNDLCKQVK